MREIIQTNLAPSAVGTYSQGVKFNGICYFSGQIGLSPETMEMDNNFDGQLQQTLKNIDGLLKSQDMTRSDIIKTTIFLKDLGDFNKVNEAYTNFLIQSLGCTGATLGLHDGYSKVHGDHWPRNKLSV